MSSTPKIFPIQFLPTGHVDNDAELVELISTINVGDFEIYSIDGEQLTKLSIARLDLTSGFVVDRTKSDAVVNFHNANGMWVSVKGASCDLAFQWTVDPCYRVGAGFLTINGEKHQVLALGKVGYDSFAPQFSTAAAKTLVSILTTPSSNVLPPYPRCEGRVSIPIDVAAIHNVCKAILSTAKSHGKVHGSQAAEKDTTTQHDEAVFAHAEAKKAAAENVLHSQRQLIDEFVLILTSIVRGVGLGSELQEVPASLDLERYLPEAYSEKFGTPLVERTYVSGAASPTATLKGVSLWTEGEEEVAIEGETTAPFCGGCFA